MGDSIGVVFTGPDKALLDRSARAAEAQAKLLGWEALTGTARKKAKLEYDRLMRDAHDLRLMGVRLTKVAMALRAPAEKPSAPMLATAPFRDPERRSGTDRRVYDYGYRPLGGSPGSGSDPSRRSGVDRRKST